MLNLLYYTFYCYNTCAIFLFVINLVVTFKLNINHVTISVLHGVFNFTKFVEIFFKKDNRSVEIVKLFMNLSVYVGCSVLLDMLNSEYGLIYKWLMSQLNFSVLFVIAYVGYKTKGNKRT
jgi:hypothetical protein